MSDCENRERGLGSTYKIDISGLATKEDKYILYCYFLVEIVTRRIIK